MKNNNLFPVNFTRRITAFFIDAFIMYIVRSLLSQFLLFYWFRKYLMDFITGFNFTFGDDFKIESISEIHLRYFMQSSIYPKFILFLVILMSLGFVYNLIMLSTKWSATFGQKLLGIYSVSKNETNMKWYQIIVRSFLIMLPWNIIIIMAVRQYMGQLGVIATISPQSFILLTGFGLLIWYDLFFFTKDKLVMHDLLSGTKVVKQKEVKKGFFDRFFGLIDKLTPNLNKMTKNLKSFTKNTIKEAKEIKKDIEKKKVKKKTKTNKKSKKKKD